MGKLTTTIETTDDPAVILTQRLKDERALANRAAELAAHGQPLPAGFTQLYDPNRAIRAAQHGLSLLARHRVSYVQGAGGRRFPYCDACRQMAPCVEVKELCKLHEVTI